MGMAVDDHNLPVSCKNIAQGTGQRCGADFREAAAPAAGSFPKPYSDTFLKNYLPRFPGIIKKHLC